MKRHYITVEYPEKVNIINNTKLKINKSSYVVIEDDINYNDINTISRVIKFVKNNNISKIILSNCKKNLYLYFVNYAKKNNIKISVNFDKEKYSVKDIYNMYDISTKLILNDEDKINNIFDINLNDIDKVKIMDLRISKGNELTLKEMIEALDYIAKQVAYYAENDIQKVLLVDKMLRENTSFDTLYYYNKEYFDNMKNNGEYLHKSHILETIFIDKKVVCNVYSLFAHILFKHPLLNSVIVNEVFGLCNDEGHAWNEIKIHNRWYTQDFTHNVWFDKRQGVNYTLKHKTNPTLKKEDDSGFDYLHTMPEEVIKMEYEKIKDIHIKFPTMEQIKTGNFDLSETVDNKMSTRRNVLSNEKELSTRRAIKLSDSNNESTRRKIKIIARRRNVLKDN